MKVFRNFAFCIAVFLISGCVSLPQTMEEFRSSATGQHVFSTSKSLESSYQLVAANTVLCHQGDTEQMFNSTGNFFVFPTSQTRVEGAIDLNKGTAAISIQYFNPVGSGLLQVIDFKRISSVNTQIVVHKINETKKWRTATESVEGWFSGGKSCFHML